MLLKLKLRHISMLKVKKSPTLEWHGKIKKRNLLNLSANSKTRSNIMSFIDFALAMINTIGNILLNIQNFIHCG